MTERFHGAKLVLTCGDGLLLLLRDDIPTIQWPGHWDLPGGGREGDETPEACALRELEDHKVRAAFLTAIEAAARRSRELSAGN